MKGYLRFEWEAIAGIIAAVAAIVLHFLHIVEPDVLLVIAVVLMAVLFARDLRKERVLERIETAVEENRGNKVRSIEFVLDENQRPLWEREVAPKIAACADRRKVQQPRWGKIEENVSAVISEVTPEGTTEALLSFWGEPFMARASGQDVPRYIFHVQGHSELVTRLLELERKYRLGR